MPMTDKERDALNKEIDQMWNGWFRSDYEYRMKVFERNYVPQLPELETWNDFFNSMCSKGGAPCQEP